MGDDARWCWDVVLTAKERSIRSISSWASVHTFDVAVGEPPDRWTASRWMYPAEELREMVSGTAAAAELEEKFLGGDADANGKAYLDVVVVAPDTGE